MVLEQFNLHRVGVKYKLMFCTSIWCKILMVNRGLHYELVSQSDEIVHLCLELLNVLSIDQTLNVHKFITT